MRVITITFNYEIIQLNRAHAISITNARRVASPCTIYEYTMNEPHLVDAVVVHKTADNFQILTHKTNKTKILYLTRIHRKRAMRIHIP